MASKPICVPQRLLAELAQCQALVHFPVAFECFFCLEPLRAGDALVRLRTCNGHIRDGQRGGPRRHSVVCTSAVHSKGAGAYQLLVKDGVMLLLDQVAR